MTEPPPPPNGISVPLAEGTLTAIRERAGKSGVFAYPEAAQRQVERDNLDEIITDMTPRTGEPTPGEVAAAETELFGIPTSSTTTR